MTLRTTDPVSVWTLGAQLGEGPVWVGRDAALWFVDIKGHRVHRYDPATGEKRSRDSPGQCGFVLPAAGGGFVAGMQQGLHHFDPRTGRFTLLLDPEPELPGNRLNDATVDPRGRLWFGTMDDGEGAPTGRIHRLAADGSCVAASPPCCITNGPAVSPDGRTLYHIDTVAGLVFACRVTDDGRLEDREVLVRLDGSQGHPDGPTVDAEGCLWIGLFGGWGARRYSPRGELLQTVRFPVANVTKLAFGGPDLRTVFATTAAKGLPPEELARQPQAGDLFSFTTDVPGLPGHEVREGLGTRAG